MRRISEELFLSGAVYMCYYITEGNGPFLVKMEWLLATIWETLALGLAVWTAAKHFRELQRESTGWAVTTPCQSDALITAITVQT
jgi:preprotein translocase subunit SecG